MLDKDEILNIVASELSNADYSTFSGEGNSLEESLAYYLGRPNGTEVEGRSKITSTDVADSIEWIMPQIMKSFTQNNEVVVFDPVHEGDERQAELESEYVYEILMKQNDGFIILHQFVKDALMQRNGIIKTYYANETCTKTKNYTGLSEQQAQQLLMADNIELVEKTEYVDQEQTEMKKQQLQMQMQQMQQQGQQQLQQMQQQGQQPPPEMVQQFQQQMQQLQAEMEKPVMLYDLKVSIKRIKGRIYVDSVAPEEFRVNSQHNSINLDDARFTAHVMNMTSSDIVKEYGLTQDETKELPEGEFDYNTEYRFALQDDSQIYDTGNSEDPAERELEVSECYMRIDIDETGISKLMKITVAGSEAPTEILSADEIDCMPWVSTTAFLMSHKFQGLSITDRLVQIQDHKTAIWRNMMDNMYLQNNQRNVVVEGQVNMDDLLVSRPGGIIRAKRLDAISPLVTPQLGPDSYNMMEYLDKVRAGRTGVDAEGGATPQNIGDRVGSQGVDRMMNAKEELVGLIIRVVAETGLKPLCVKIRDLSVQHVDAVVDFRFRGVWQQINPAQWLDRTHCTVRVGTGTGNHMAQLAALREVMAAQEKILANPQQTILSEQKVYTAIDDFCKFSGLNGATRYFIDPESPEGKENAGKVSKQNKEAKQKEEQMQIAMAQSQMELAKAEQAKAQAQMVSAQAKAESDNAKNQLQLQKQTFEGQIDMLNQELAEAKAIADNMGQTADLRLRKYQIDQSTALELTRIEADKEAEENENFKQNQADVSNG